MFISKPYLPERQWFLARIVYRILCGEGCHTAQFDEQLRLIEAPNQREALEKALKMGKMEEDCFPNADEQLVRWKFINVTDLYKLGPQIDGAEVYSRIEEREPAEAYIQMLNQKAELLFRQPIREQLTG